MLARSARRVHGAIPIDGWLAAAGLESANRGWHGDRVFDVDFARSRRWFLEGSWCGIGRALKLFRGATVLDCRAERLSGIVRALRSPVHRFSKEKIPHD